MPATATTRDPFEGLPAEAVAIRSADGVYMTVPSGIGVIYLVGLAAIADRERQDGGPITLAALRAARRRDMVLRYRGGDTECALTGESRSRR